MRIRFLKIIILVSILCGIFYFYRSHYEVPILMYHQISDNNDDPGLQVSSLIFARQMEFLKIHNYQVISLLELSNRIQNHQPIPTNTVVITFDDGYLNNFTNAFPVLKKMNFPATIFMITKNIGQEGWLGEEDLKILDESGIDIGSHTVNHAFFPKESTEEIKRQVTDSKERLEEILGHPVLLFSYPAGGVTEASKTIVSQAGYQAAVTTNYGTKKNDLYALRRIKIKNSNNNLFDFWLKLSGIYRIGKKSIEIT